MTFHTLAGPAHIPIQISLYQPADCKSDRKSGAQSCQVAQSCRCNRSKTLPLALTTK